jgi:hypothetical protein
MPHLQALGVLIKKISVPRFQFYFFSPKPRFYFCEASLSKFLSNENNFIAKVGSKKPSGVQSDSE